MDEALELPIQYQSAGANEKHHSPDQIRRRSSFMTFFLQLVYRVALGMIMLLLQ